MLPYPIGQAGNVAHMLHARCRMLFWDTHARTHLLELFGGPDPTHTTSQNCLMQKLMVVHRLDLFGGADPTDIIS